MKILSLTLFLAFICNIGFAQPRQNIDFYKHQLNTAKHDTSRVLSMANLTWAYQFSNPDSALLYAKRAELLADKIRFPSGKVAAMGFESNVYIGLGNLPKALEIGFKALQIADSNNIVTQKAVPLSAIGLGYTELKDYPKATFFIREMMKACKLDSNSSKVGLAFAEMNLGTIFEEINQLDSAAYYLHRSEFHFKHDGPYIYSQVSRELGNIQVKLGNSALAFYEYKKSIQLGIINSDHRNLSLTYTQMARLYKKLSKRDSSIYFARKGLTEAEIINQKKGILEAASFLSELYDPFDPKQAYHYYKIAANAKEGLFGAGNIQAIQEMVKQVEERQLAVETAKITYQNQLKQYALLAGLAVLLVIAFFLYRNNQKEKKAKNVLQEKNEEIQSTLSKLKSTQNQLIQSEKLASLGDLTAGIAHEIQNPLNFVNNFSELSKELIQELLEEESKPLNTQDPILKTELLTDLSANQEKINHHGKRASSIVTGMLQHSQASSGVKELTDINKLADEFLRLSFNSFKAKNKDFNCKIETIFDENLPTIEVITQDIGRVLINLMNNAFYAVSNNVHVETGHALSLPTQYQLTVTISTHKSDSQIIIKIKDNGTGMSEATKLKIFQPFFTTKPTGQGTGLGLSLAYDIVTKGHGGTIEVLSKEGEGSTFIVKLPI